MNQKSSAYVALGANLDDPERSLRLALSAISDHPQLELAETSSFYRTKPVGGSPDQPDYCNAVIRIFSEVNPEATLRILQEIEDQLGRIRKMTWDARTVDLDLLAFDYQVMASDLLLLPHPRMTVRQFVVNPFCEIAPDWVHPQLGWSMRQIQDHLSGFPRVVRLSENQHREIGYVHSWQALQWIFQDQLPGWRLVSESEMALFEVSLPSNFLADETWDCPRFYATDNDPELCLEQVLATCRGLTDNS